MKIKWPMRMRFTNNSILGQKATTIIKVLKEGVLIPRPTTLNKRMRREKFQK